MLDAQILHGKASLYTVAYEHSYTKLRVGSSQPDCPGRIVGYPEPGTTGPVSASPLCLGILSHVVHLPASLLLVPAQRRRLLRHFRRRHRHLGGDGHGRPQAHQQDNYPTIAHVRSAPELRVWNP
jgi:hypothetical protein